MCASPEPKKDEPKIASSDFINNEQNPESTNENNTGTPKKNSGNCMKLLL